MERVPEPELMEDDLQAEAYARADFAEPNTLFCQTLLDRLDPPERARVVDLGCGPADIPVRLARLRPAWTLDAVDGSPAMLRHASDRVRDEGLSDRVHIHCSLLPALSLPEAEFDLVISNSLLHHLPDPSLMWREVSRLARPGALLALMDLMRPDSREAAENLVERYSGGEPEVLRHDFAASLLAAFTPDEVREQLRETGLEKVDVAVISDRHLFAYGFIG